MKVILRACSGNSFQKHESHISFEWKCAFRVAHFKITCVSCPHSCELSHGFQQCTLREKKLLKVKQKSKDTVTSHFISTLVQPSLGFYDNCLKKEYPLSSIIEDKKKSWFCQRRMGRLEERWQNSKSNSHTHHLWTLATSDFKDCCQLLETQNWLNFTFFSWFSILQGDMKNYTNLLFCNT